MHSKVTEGGMDGGAQLKAAVAPGQVSKDKRILVVGAGPSAIHMASKLKSLGYGQITVLEKTDRVGGKSFTLYRNPKTQKECQQDQNGVVDTVNCVAIETGTCFLHNGYGHVRDLLHDYSLNNEIPMKDVGIEVCM